MHFISFHRFKGVCSPNICAILHTSNTNKEITVFVFLITPIQKTYTPIWSHWYSQRYLLLRYAPLPPDFKHSTWYVSSTQVRQPVVWLKTGWRIRYLYSPIIPPCCEYYFPRESNCVIVVRPAEDPPHQTTDNFQWSSLPVCNRFEKASTSQIRSRSLSLRAYIHEWAF